MSSRKSKPKIKSRKSRKSHSSRKSQKSHSSRKSRKSHSSRKSRKSHRKVIMLPKTMKVPSKKTKSVQRVKVSRADTNMSMSDLEFMAKSMGIPFGGLNKTQLVRKINNYF